jgi:hypothetical protein
MVSVEHTQAARRRVLQLLPIARSANRRGQEGLRALSSAGRRVSRDRTSSQALNAQFAGGRHVERTQNVEVGVEQAEPPRSMPAFDATRIAKKAEQRLKPVTSRTRCVGDAWKRGNA